MDHSSLGWVFKTQKPSTRLIRWALRLQEFIFTVEYRKGKYNTVPDAWSRARVQSDDYQFSTCATVQPAKREMTRGLPISDEIIWKTQQADPEILKVYKSVVETGDQRAKSTTHFIILEDKVYRVVQLPQKALYQVYIPSSLRPQ